MLIVIIWLIIVVFIIYSRLKKQNQPQTNEQSQYGHYGKRQDGPNDRALNRPQRPNLSGMPTQQGQQEGSILDRANAYAKRNDGDICKQYQMGSASSAKAKAEVWTINGAVNTENASDLMLEVNDLIIKGYEADFTFQRDFVAEGVEMLNRFEVPGGN